MLPHVSSELSKRVKQATMTPTLIYDPVAGQARERPAPDPRDQMG
jgi:hypothetical protein